VTELQVILVVVALNACLLGIVFFVAYLLDDMVRGNEPGTPLGYSAE